MKLMDIDSKHLGILEAEDHAILPVVISVTNEGVKFSKRGDIGTANIVCRHNTSVDKPEESTIIEMNEPVSLTFALRRLSSELPVVVEHKIAETGYIRFYLVPKIVDEEGMQVEALSKTTSNCSCSCSLSKKKIRFAGCEPLLNV